MDYERIELALVERVHNAYKDFSSNNPPPIPLSGRVNRGANRLARREYDDKLVAFKGRDNDLLGKVRAHRAWLTEREARMAQKTVYIESLVTLRDAIKHGARILAFDVERAYPNDNFPFGQLREVGYTTYRRGKMESFNLRSETATRPRWIGFAYGNTKRLPETALLERMLKEMERADFYVGHSLRVDIEFLNDLTNRRLPRRLIYDTFDLSYLVDQFGRGRSEANLSNVAKYYGIEFRARIAVGTMLDIIWNCCSRWWINWCPMLKDHFLLMRRNSMTPGEREQMASLNTKFHGAIVHLVAYFTANEKGSTRPFRLEVGQGSYARKHYFSTLDQLEDFAEKRLIKEQKIVDELQKMRVMLKMYDLNQYAIIRQTRIGLRPYSIQDTSKNDSYRRSQRYDALRFFDTIPKMWVGVHHLIAEEAARVALQEIQDADM